MIKLTLLYDECGFSHMAGEQAYAFFLSLLKDDPATMIASAEEISITGPWGSMALSKDEDTK